MKRLTALGIAAGLLALTLPAPQLHGQTVTFTGTELLGRPTDTSIALNVVANAAIQAYVAYGTASGTTYPNQTAVVSAAANEPLVVSLTSLQPNTRYYYRVMYRLTGASAWTPRSERTFVTQRPAGSTFTFTVVGDSHINVLLGNSSLYQRTLQNIAGERPDFHLDLGDTFAMDNVTTQSGANSAYLAARTNFGLIGHSSPVFLALGNHEQEEGWHLDDTGNIATSKPVLGANARKRYYLNPNPIRDPFYSGNVDQVAAVSGDHLLDDYYAWEWGDALFVVIDPYWYTMRKPFTGNLGGGEGSDPGSGDRWDWTLGWTQYAWLQQTLQNSHARYKFIFAHHGTGGTQDYIRGGANGVPYGEWGGRNEDGTTWAFDARRPGWPLPVHDVLVQNGVSAFFHAHDHEYAYEKRDGVVYQLVPMPSDSGNGFGFNLYRETDPYTLRVLPNSGHLRVTVSPSNTNVEYVRAFVSGGTNGQVAHAYTISPAGGGTPPSPPSVTALSVAPTTVVGGAANATGTVTINTSAPLGGAAVALTSNNAAAAVPASVTVPANATTATFPITTTAVTSSTAATITANLNGSASATLTVTAPAPPSPPSVTALSVSPTSVVGGTGGATGTVTINPSAPQGGATVALTSNNAAATVPASVTVPANATTATFPITTAAVTSSTTATITASLNGSATATLTVTAPAPPATVNPVRINSGGSGYTDGQGRQWSADGSFSGGSAFSSTRTIANTSDQALYQNSRYGSSFTYTINVPAGTYAVTLKFAELYWSSSGGRVFNVSINGTGVLSNFDIVSAAGGSFRAVDRTFTVTTTGPITLRFSVGSAGNPLVNAIQVAPM